MATVAIGAMQWNVPIAELVPQLIRNPEPAPADPKTRPAQARPTIGIDQFSDE